MACVLNSKVLWSGCFGRFTFAWVTTSAEATELKQALDDARLAHQNPEELRRKTCRELGISADAHPAE